MILRLKRYGLVILTIALVALFACLSDFSPRNPGSAKQIPAEDLPLAENPIFNGFSSSSPHPLHFVMAKHDFWIPRYYVDSFSRKDSVEQSGVLLFANLPGLLPTLEEKRDQATAFKNLDKFIAIGIEDATRYPNSFQGIYNLRRGHQPSWELQTPKYGLRFELPAKPAAPRFNSELYVEERENGEPKSYIECSLSESVPAPTCRHHFEYEGLFINLSYRKTHLRDWKEVEVSTISLINSFKKKPSKGRSI